MADRCVPVWLCTQWRSGKERLKKLDWVGARPQPRWSDVVESHAWLQMRLQPLLQEYSESLVIQGKAGNMSHKVLGLAWVTCGTIASSTLDPLNDEERLLLEHYFHMKDIRFFDVCEVFTLRRPVTVIQRAGCDNFRLFHIGSGMRQELLDSELAQPSPLCIGQLLESRGLRVNACIPVIQVAAPIALLAMRGSWRRLPWLPCWRSEAYLWPGIPTLKPCKPQPLVFTPDCDMASLISPARWKHLALQLIDWAPIIIGTLDTTSSRDGTDDEDDEEQIIDCTRAKLEGAVTWLLEAHQALTDNSLVEYSRGGTDGRRFKAVAMLHLLIADDFLCGSTHLKRVLYSIVTAIFPALRTFVRKMLDGCALPGKSSITRARLSMDVAYMLHMREEFVESLTLMLKGDMATLDMGKVGFRTMLADGSPQGGKEFLLIESVHTWASDIVRIGNAVATLARHSAVLSGMLDDTDEQLEVSPEMEAVLDANKIIRTAVVRHNLVPMVLGARALTVLHKLQALCHAAWLETGSMATLLGYLTSVSCWCTDGGTEGFFGHTCRLDLMEMFPPWMAPLHVQADDGGLSDEGDCVVQKYYAYGAFFPLAVQIIGMMHTLHNISSMFCTSLSCWDWFCERLTALSQLLANSDNRKRIQVTCFQDGPLAAGAWLLDYGVAKLVKWRWGSVMHVLQDVLRLEHLLSSGFNLQSYLKGSSQDADLRADFDNENNRTLAIVGLRTAVTAIHSVRFWCTARVLMRIQSFLHSLEGWVGSCHCHPDVKIGKSRYSRQKSYAQMAGSEVGERMEDSSCPLTGCLVPEIVCGALERELAVFQAEHHGQLLIDISRMCADDRTDLIKDYELAVGQISDALNIKLAYFYKLPICLAGMASVNADEAQRAAHMCIQQYDAVAEDSLHHNLSKLFLNREGPFRQHVEALAAGTCLH